MKHSPEAAAAPPGSAASFEGRVKVCPKCKFKGDVRDYFGLRWVQGKRQAQSYCFICRRKPPKEAKPTLPTDTEELRKLYQEHYPKDTHRRGPKIMRERLGKKLGLETTGV